MMEDVTLTSEMVGKLSSFLPGLVTLIVVVAILSFANFFQRRNLQGELSVSRQIFMLLLTAAGVLFFIFSLPLSEASRGQVLGLLGIVITAVIALSSTTFVANIMAGLMMRAVNSFQPGDFIRSENFFGRVTERGIFHTEIQTEDRDLMTLPNMYLVTNPVTVVHNSGTIISATLSLGYDVSHVKVEELLKQATEETGLADGFVLIVDLNDFSVSYRVGGFYSDITRLLTIKSTLRKTILTMLHENDIEIVSPNFMNQRVLSPDERVIPDLRDNGKQLEESSAPEDMIFDKADSAAEREALKRELIAAQERLKAIKEELKSQKNGDTASLDSERAALTDRVEEIGDRMIEDDSAKKDE